jgi:hypothetical protein
MNNATVRGCLVASLDTGSDGPVGRWISGFGRLRDRAPNLVERERARRLLDHHGRRLCPGSVPFS